jgi:hypothetical protein
LIPVQHKEKYRGPNTHVPGNKSVLGAISHETLTALRALLLSRRFQRAFAAAPPPVQVNIGAGNVHLDGWINTAVSNALSAGRGIRLVTPDVERPPAPCWRTRG